MPNYFFAISTQDKANQIASLFEPDSLSISRLGESATCLYVSNSDIRSASGFFRGYAVDHEAETITFEQRGAENYPDPWKPVEGCYFRAKRTENGFVVGNDLFAQMSMLYLSAPGITAISDSLFVLAEIRKHLGLPCRLNEEVLSARLWMNAMADQLLGTETPVHDISFSLPCTVLEIDARKIELTVHQQNVREIFRAGIADYGQTISEAAERMVRLTKTIFSTDSVGSLSISGGMDSRVCLAAALAGGDADTVSINSDRRREVDFQIVTRLSDQFGFQINKPVGSQFRPKLEKVDRMALWTIACMGIYDPLYCPSAVNLGRTLFSITGHGAELMKGNYGWRTIRAITRKLELAEVQAQCENTLNSMGIDPADKWGSEWHYLGMRNSIHGGRSTMTRLTGMRPLAQRKLVALSRSEMNQYPAPRKGAPSIISDLLIALSPDLALAMFDDPRKNMTLDHVTNRLRAIGGRVSARDSRPYKVFGSPQAATGPVKSFLAMAVKKGLSGAIDARSIQSLVTLAVDFSPPKLATCYRNMVGKVVTEVKDPIDASTRVAVSAGKILTLLLAS